MIQVLNPNERPEISPSITGLLIQPINEWKGSKQPPRNKILVKIDISTILAYSAKKKNTKIAAECSVINPETNSDSEQNIIMY